MARQRVHITDLDVARDAFLKTFRRHRNDPDRPEIFRARDYMTKMPGFILDKFFDDYTVEEDLHDAFMDWFHHDFINYMTDSTQHADPEPEPAQKLQEAIDDNPVLKRMQELNEQVNQSLQDVTKTVDEKIAVLQQGLSDVTSTVAGIVTTLANLGTAIIELVKSLPAIIEAFNAAMSTWREFTPAMQEVAKLLKDYREAMRDQESFKLAIDEMVKDYGLSTVNPNPSLPRRNFDLAEMERYRQMFFNPWTGDQARSYLNMKMHMLYQAQSGVGYPTPLHAMQAAASIGVGLPGQQLLGMMGTGLAGAATGAVHQVPKLFGMRDEQLWQMEAMKTIHKRGEERKKKQADLNKIIEVHGNE